MAFSPETALEKLAGARARGRLAHAFLITGPPGSGKEDLASRFIRSLRPDIPAGDGLDAAEWEGVHVLRPQSRSRRIRVEQMHGLEAVLRLTLGRGRMKIGVVVAAERMMEQAQNTFLKTLEEPPEGSILLLLTPHPEQMLETIRSRCLVVELQDPPRRAPAPGSAEAELIHLLIEQGGCDQRGIRPALRLARGFQDILGACEAEIRKRHDKILAEEKARYAKATGPSDWVAQREEEIKAMARADYLQVRNGLHGAVVSWFGDALRLKAGGTRLDLPGCRDSLEAMADRLDQDSLARSLAVMEHLRDLFETNVQESLAIEACFLKAFGPPR